MFPLIVWKESPVLALSTIQSWSWKFSIICVSLRFLWFLQKCEYMWDPAVPRPRLEMCWLKGSRRRDISQAFCEQSCEAGSSRRDVELHLVINSVMRDWESWREKERDADQGFQKDDPGEKSEEQCWEKVCKKTRQGSGEDQSRAEEEFIQERSLCEPWPSPQLPQHTCKTCCVLHLILHQSNTSYLRTWESGTLDRGTWWNVPEKKLQRVVAVC